MISSMLCSKVRLFLTAFAFTIAFLLFTSIERPTFKAPMYSKVEDSLMKNAFKYKNFCVLPNVLRSEMQRDMEKYDWITLVIHISADYLDEKLIEQVDSWDGPISLSIFLPRGQVAVSMQKVILKLNEYKPRIISKLSAHLFFYNAIDCDQGMKDEPARTPAEEVYPANVGRNIGRMLSSAKYLVLEDYEIIFSNGFEAQMRALADDVLTRNPKTALVYRIFELNDTIKGMPREREHLYALYKSGGVVEFHAKYFSVGHSIPGLQEWFTRNISEPVPTLSDPIPYTRVSWEPRFVSLVTVPFHDENMPHPISVNTVLRWEMCRANYTFRVVDNVFAVHRGIKTSKEKPFRLFEIAAPLVNPAIEKFAKRMMSLYPETEKSCPSVR